MGAKGRVVFRLWEELFLVRVRVRVQGLELVL